MQSCQLGKNSQGAQNNKPQKLADDFWGLSLAIGYGLIIVMMT